MPTMKPSTAGLGTCRLLTVMLFWPGSILMGPYLNLRCCTSGWSGAVTMGTSPALTLPPVLVVDDPAPSVPLGDELPAVPVSEDEVAHAVTTSRKASANSADVR